jgi:hypothetical protein
VDSPFCLRVSEKPVYANKNLPTLVIIGVSSEKIKAYRLLFFSVDQNFQRITSDILTV